MRHLIDIVERHTKSQSVDKLVKYLKESYEEWVEGYEKSSHGLRMVLRTADGKPPSYLYRVMSRNEYDSAVEKGAFYPKPGERIHAANRPLWQHTGADTVVVQFRYDARDGWRPKWGDELYAVTDGPIPSIAQRFCEKTSHATFY